MTCTDAFLGRHNVTVYLITPSRRLELAALQPDELLELTADENPDSTDPG